MKMRLEAGEELKKGRIIIKESSDQSDPNNPEFLIKKKKGRV